MGSNLSAHLAYGYDLGSEEDFNAAERGEYGEPKLPWYGESDDDEQDDERGEEEFADAVERILLAEIGGFTETWSASNDGYYDRKRAAQARVGVEIEFSGGGGYPGWMLVATGSERSCDWSEAMTLNLDRMRVDPGSLDWDAKLAAAIKVLGITPMREADDATGLRHQRTKEPVGPSWLVYPSYG